MPTRNSNQSPTLGIDFGTSFSSAAILRNGYAEPIREPNGTGYAIPTSVLLTPEGELKVGQAAENGRFMYPERYKREFKRELGQQAPIPLGDREFPLVDLVAAVLESLRSEAEATVHTSVTSTILTVPATYAGYLRSLMDRAARQAGFTRVELLEEPVAAAIHADRQHPIAEPGALTLVYDLGGGTFDATLIRHSAGGYEIVGNPDGLEHCGGIDVDRLIYQDMHQSVSERYHEMLDPTQDELPYRQARRRFEEIATEVKVHLSQSPEYDQPLPLLFPPEHYRLTRERFNEHIAPMIGRTIRKCQEIIYAAGVSPDELSRVILVGGSTRIPLVQESLNDMFGSIIVRVDDPELAVSKGAAVSEISPAAIPVPNAYSPGYTDDQEYQPTQPAIQSDGTNSTAISTPQVVAVVTIVVLVTVILMLCVFIALFLP